MQEIRCKNCGKLLAKVEDTITTIPNDVLASLCKQNLDAEAVKLQVKCPRCKTVNETVAGTPERRVSRMRKMDLPTISKELSCFPRTCCYGHRYGCEDAVVKSNSEGAHDFEETRERHVACIVETLEKNKDKLCFVRVLPEETVLDGCLKIYTRLQFGDRDKVHWGDI